MCKADNYDIYIDIEANNQNDTPIYLIKYMKQHHCNGIS